MSFIDLSGIARHASPFQTGGHLRMTLFSDLVVIAADRANIACYKLLVKAASQLMQECSTFGYFINGCIALGKLAFDEGTQTVINAKSSSSKANSATSGKPSNYMPLFVGQSVVDAYLLTEELFCYGIVLHPSVESLHNKYMKINTEDPAWIRINVPLKKGGYAPLYYLDWTKVKLAQKSPDENQVIEELNKMLTNTSSVRARAYILNTITIYNQIVSLKKQ